MVGGTWESGDGSGSGTWEFNNGTIEFWGTGSFSPSGTAPWADYIPDAVEAIVHEGITILGSGLGALSNVVTLTLPDGLETIQGLAFFLCSSLRELVIPDSVTLIGSESSGLLSNVLPSSGVLERIVIGSGVQRIGGSAFTSCPSVKEIVFRGPKPEFLGYTFIGSTLNYNNFSLGTSESPANVIVYTKGWGSDEVFTTAIRGSYTTFEYRRLTYNITPSAIPVKVKGYFRRSHFRVNVKGVVKSKVMAWVNKKGKWIPIDDSYEGEPIPATVTFNANGGTGTMASITGLTATVPSNAFTRSKHRFDRWNTKADGSGTSYTAGQTITLSGDVTLYAIWVQQVTVYYTKKWQGDNMLWHPPGSNTGPVAGGYLDLRVGGVTVPGISDDKFTVHTDGYYSPERSITVDIGTALSVSSNQQTGSGSSVIKRNDSNVSGPATSVSYNLPGGIQRDLNILMTWRIVYSWLGQTTGSWWIIDIWDR